MYDWRSPSELGQAGQEVALVSQVGSKGQAGLKRLALPAQDRLPESWQKEEPLQHRRKP